MQRCKKLVLIYLTIDYLEFLEYFDEYKKNFSNYTFEDFSFFNREEKSNNFTQETKIYNYPNTNIFKFLFKKQVINFITTEKSFEKKIHKSELVISRYIDGYVSNIYKTVIVIKNILQINKRTKYTNRRIYTYVDDEKNHTFKNMIKNNFTEKIIYDSKKLNKIAQETLYFSHKVPSFLKKQGVFLIDDLFLTKNEYYNYIYDKKNINLLHDEEIEDFNFKLNRKKIISNSKKYKKK